MQIIYLISKLINHWMAGLHNLKTILSSCSSYLCINWIGLDAVPLDFCIPEWSTKICKKCNLEKLLYMFAIFLANSAISLYEIPIGFQLAYTQKASCTRPSPPGSNYWTPSNLKQVEMSYVIQKININSWSLPGKKLKILCMIVLLMWCTIFDYFRCCVGIQELHTHTYTIQSLKCRSLIKYSCSQSTFCKRVSKMIIYQKRYLQCCNRFKGLFTK